MLNPLKWKYEDQVGLITATAFGATFGLASSYSPGQGWFNALWALIGAVVVGGAFYCYRAFR
jgi:CDP-diglyceride synthetase